MKELRNPNLQTLCYVKKMDGHVEHLLLKNFKIWNNHKTWSTH